jgi:hypothetical protein
VTRLVSVKTTCAVCADVAEHTQLQSTNSYGSPDLDTRPHGMARDTIPFWVHCCAKCGYCAADITVAPPIAASIVRSVEYQQQRVSKQFSALANHLLCAALIAEAAGDHFASGEQSAAGNQNADVLADSHAYESAVRFAVCAAWASDDAHSPWASGQCRMRAFELAQHVWVGGSRLIDTDGADEVMICDVLRRSGQFGQVYDIVEAGLAKRPDPAVTKMLQYEEALASSGDARRHTIRDAERWRPDAPRTPSERARAILCAIASRFRARDGH